MRKRQFITWIVLLLLLLGCGSSRKLTNETITGEIREEIIVPCNDYSSNSKEHFRATANATSPNLQFAKDKAMVLARTALASRIETDISALFDVYTQQHDIEDKEDFREVAKQITRQVTDQKLRNINVVCEKNYTLSSGVYEVWIGLETTIESIAQSVYNKVSDEKKTRLDYDYLKFKEELLKEMEKRRDLY